MVLSLSFCSCSLSLCDDAYFTFDALRCRCAYGFLSLKFVIRTRIQAWDLSSSCQRATNKTGQPTHWMATSIAINLVLLLSYLLPKDYTPGPAHVKSTSGCSSGILAFSATATPASNPLPCSGRGYLKSVTDGSLGICKCHACYGGADCSKTDGACVIDLDQ